MVILLLKSKRETADEDDADKEPLPAKMRRIVLVRVKEAKTPEDKERAERELRKVDGAAE